MIKCSGYRYKTEMIKCVGYRYKTEMIKCVSCRYKWKYLEKDSIFWLHTYARIHTGYCRFKNVSHFPSDSK